LKHFLLVVHEFISNLAVQSFFLKNVFPVLALFLLNQLEIYFFNHDCVLSPLSPQMLLVHSQIPSIFRHLNKCFSILWAVLVEQIHSGVENRDALLVPIHVLLVSVGLGIDLLTYCFHKVRNNLIELLFVLNLCRLAMLEARLDHTNYCVGLGDSDLSDT